VLDLRNNLGRKVNHTEEVVAQFLLPQSKMYI
jgi:hypothetical protein